MLASLLFQAMHYFPNCTPIEVDGHRNVDIFNKKKNLS